MVVAMKNGYVEVKLRNFPNASELLGILTSPPSLGSWEDGEDYFIYWPEASWNDDVLKKLKSALASLGMNDATASIRFLPEQDWNAKWAASIQPVRIGKKVRIRQSWNPSDPGFAGIELIIDPKRAFGSGSHATTQLLIEMLEEQILDSCRLLDLGTGSGVLAMVALRMGAASALGVDIDPDAIECAKENAALNGFGDALQLLTGTLDDVGSERFELVLANLDRNTFLKIGGQLGLHVKTGGKALLSGLQFEDLPDIAPIIADSGGTILTRRERDEWIAIEVAY
jgi:ribosomal protein L11 methyltransferase